MFLRRLGSSFKQRWPKLFWENLLWQSQAGGIKLIERFYFAQSGGRTQCHLVAIAMRMQKYAC